MAGLDPAKQSGAECAPLVSRLLPRLSLGVAMTAGIGFASQSNNVLCTVRRVAAAASPNGLTVRLIERQRFTGRCARRNARTWSIVLAFSSGGSRHG